MARLLIGLLVAFAQTVSATEVSLPPNTPNFDLADLEQLDNESKAAKVLWEEYQQAMTIAFDLTQSFLAADRAYELKVQAVNRFLQTWADNDNPFSDQDNEQVSAIEAFLDNNIDSSSLKKVPTQISGLQAALEDELALSIEPECALIFEHCLHQSFIDLPPLDTGDQYVRFEPLLVMRDGYWFAGGDAEQTKRFSGLLKSYLPNGQLSSQVSVKNGLKHGPFTRWYPTGELAAEGSYKKGQLSGTFQEWYENGKLRRATTMRKGIRSKTETLWYEEGVKKAEIGLSSSSDVLNGRTQAWFANGNLAFDGRFSVGRVFREHLLFYPDGKIAAKYKLVSKGTCYQERMQDSLRIQCPPQAINLIKKIGSHWDTKGQLRWSSSQSKLTSWSENGAEMGIIKNGRDPLYGLEQRTGL